MMLFDINCFVLIIVFVCLLSLVFVLMVVCSMLLVEICGILNFFMMN